MLTRLRITDWNWRAAIPLLALFGIAIYGGTLPVPPPTQTTPSTRDKAADQEVTNVDPNERIASYTFGLEVFTGIVAFSALLNIWVLWRTDSTARRTARIALRQTQIAARQLRITAAQTDIQTKQHALGRQQHLAEYRPRLRVRHVMLGTPQVPLRTPNVDSEVTGGLVVVNVGGTKATIIDSRYLIHFARTFDGLPMHSPLDDHWTELFVPDAPALEIGESRALPISGNVWIGPGVAPGTLLVLARTEWCVYVMGQIRYQDDGGNDRFMGFCRQWAGEATFRAVNDPDYEYED